MTSLLSLFRDSWLVLSTSISHCYVQWFDAPDLCWWHVGVTEGGGKAQLRPWVSGSGISHYRSPWTLQTVVGARGSKSHEDCGRCGHDLTLALLYSSLPSLLFFQTCLTLLFCWTLRQKKKKKEKRFESKKAAAHSVKAKKINKNLIKHIIWL